MSSMTTTLDSCRLYNSSQCIEYKTTLKDKQLKYAWDKAQQYADKQELPQAWDKVQLLGVDNDSDEVSLIGF